MEFLLRENTRYAKQSLGISLLAAYQLYLRWLTFSPGLNDKQDTFYHFPVSLYHTQLPSLQSGFACSIYDVTMYAFK